MNNVLQNIKTKFIALTKSWGTDHFQYTGNKLTKLKKLHFKETQKLHTHIKGAIIIVYVVAIDLIAPFLLHTRELSWFRLPNYLRMPHPTFHLDLVIFYLVCSPHFRMFFHSTVT